jgi:hypothetical protein
MNNSQREISLLDMARRLPWYWALWMYLVTAIFFVLLVLIAGIARTMSILGQHRRADKMMSRNLQRAHELRNYLMGPATRKYLLFDIIAGEIDL